VKGDGILSYSESQKNATIKYMQKLKRIPIDVKPEKYDFYKSHADKLGLSVRAFILQAIDEKIEREKEV
jgi:uncharacterized protein (DUF1778 family)